jgi:hypothetical protein
MGWSLETTGLPEGYRIVEWEDGLTLLNAQGTVIAEFGAFIADLSVILGAAWDDAGPNSSPTLRAGR